MIHYYIVDSNRIKTETTENEYSIYFKKQRKAGAYTSSNEEHFYGSVEEAVK